MGTRSIPQSIPQWVFVLIGVVGILVYLYFNLSVGPTKRDPRPVAESPAAAIEALASRDDLNVLFILIDTLRADRLGVYGYERDTSPFVDRLASQGIRFSRNMAQSSWTKASMASMWTSLYPLRAGVTKFDQSLSLEAEMPAEILSAAGFRTIGLYRNGWVSGYFGFEQGFDEYHKPLGEPIPASVRRENPNYTQKGSDQGLITDAIEYLRIHGDEKWFLYIHMMDVHEFVYDEDSALFGTTNSDVYDNAIRRTDSLVQQLYEYLSRSGELEKTVIVLASDHGEAFGERGFEGHAREVFSETTETPVILSLPFRLDPGLVVPTRTANVDIWPTLFDLLGISAPGADRVDGRSKLPEILAAARGEGEASEEAEGIAIAHLDQNWGQPTPKPKNTVSVTEGPLRLVIRPLQGKQAQLFLFDVEDGEDKNLIGDYPEEAAHLGEIARSYLESKPIWSDEAPRLEIDEMELNQLRALGYQLP
jgi:hypothetical protein